MANYNLVNIVHIWQAKKLLIVNEIGPKQQCLSLKKNELKQQKKICFLTKQIRELYSIRNQRSMQSSTSNESLYFCQFNLSLVVE